MRRIRIMLLLVLITYAAGQCFGQDFKLDTSISWQSDDAVGKTITYQTSMNQSDQFFNRASLYEFSAFGGMGVDRGSSMLRGSLHFGVDMRILRSGYGHLYGMLYEIGYAGTMHEFTDGAALFSGNYLGSTLIGKSKRLLLFGTVGYTVVLGTDDAVNFGVGIDIAVAKEKALRIEVRDYLTYEDPDEHNVALRLAFVLFGPSNK